MSYEGPRGARERPNDDSMIAHAIAIQYNCAAMAERRVDRLVNPFVPPAECGVGELQELPENLRSFAVLPQDGAMHERIFQEVDFPEQQVNSLLGPAGSEEFYALCQKAQHIEVIEDCESGKIAGYAILGQAKITGMLGMFNQFHPDLTAEVQSLVINTDYQGKGAGSRLLAVCERAAQDAGYVDMILKTHKNNASILFYKSKGYALEGVYNVDRDSDRWILNKSIGTPEARARAEVKLERMRRIKKVNRALDKLFDGKSLRRGSQQSIDAHVAQYLENRQMTIEDLSPEHRMLLVGELRLHNSGAIGGRSLRDYAAGVLQTDREAINLADEAYILFQDNFRPRSNLEPEVFSYDMQSDKAVMANEPLDERLQLVIVNDELRHSRDVISADLHLKIRKSLARLAQDNPPTYVPRQMSKMIEWFDHGLMPSYEPSQQRNVFMYQRVLSVFHQLAYCPDQVDTFLEMPAVTQSIIVKDQPVMNILPLRLWNASGNPNTVVRLLEFAQQHAPDGLAVAQYFVENILVLLQPGRERQMAELMERLPAVLPEAQRQQLQDKLAADKLWQIALRMGSDH